MSDDLRQQAIDEIMVEAIACGYDGPHSVPSEETIAEKVREIRARPGFRDRRPAFPKVDYSERERLR